jgi:hypothetical protein
MTRLAAKGTKFQYGNGSGTETFTDMAQVRSIGDLGGDSGEIDTTDLSSTAKEYLMGLPDNGDLQLTLAWDPADARHVAMFTRETTQSLNNYKIVMSDTGAFTWAFSAYVKSFKITGMTPDSLIEAQVTLRISGAIVGTP